MKALDPVEDDDSTSPTAPSDTGSTDASTGKFQKAWEAWNSKPENNAALLQFGISMLQPHAPGQDSIGAAANAVGSAGEAASRSIASQKAQEAADSAEEDKAAQRANQATTAGSGRITAQAYADSVKNAALKPGGATNELRTQASFRSWLAKPEDTTGMLADPVLGAIQKQFPDVKTKADLLANPAAKAAAYAMFKSQVADPGDGGGTGDVVVPPTTTPKIRTIYKDGKPYSWDGVNPPVPQ